MALDAFTRDKRMNHWSRFGWCGALLCIRSGCAIISRGVFSAPYADGASPRHDMSPDYEEGMRLIGAHDHVQFDLSELKLSLKALNVQKVDEVLIGPVVLILLPVIPWPPGVIGLFRELPAARAPLSFEIRLEPEGEGFSFDPMRSTLQTPEGETIRPSRFDGPTHGRGYKNPCGSDVFSAVATRIPLEQFSCFRLEFDTAISIDKHFTLAIQGLERAGQLVPVPLVSFENGASWRLWAGM